MSLDLSSTPSLNYKQWPNLSSGYTNIQTENAIQCGLPKVTASAQNDKCCSGSTIVQPVAMYQSMLLKSKVCPQPSPEEFALYPKVAVASSVRTQLLSSQACTASTNRFSQYDRYQIPVPCQALPQEAAMAGISRGTTLNCNIYPQTGR